MAEKRKLFEQMKRNCAHWINETAKLYPPGVSHPNALSASSFTSRRDFTREILAQRLTRATQILYSQMDYVSHLENEVQQLKSDMIKKQETVIELQEELISAKNTQLGELTEAVVSSIGSTVKTELKTYSEAVAVQKSVQSGAGRNASILDQDVLKSVVKDVVAEEDRSRNFVIFGLEETPDELIEDKVGCVLQELGAKPKLEASRIGLKLNKQTPRTVKVSVSSSSIVAQILSNAKKLRDSERFQ